ncbi:MAG: orotate phosphoribosyltransferase [bacterium]|nr:orotate phosphoribosyltransferase [bacterium]
MANDGADLLSELRSSGALHQGHFRLSSGLHSNLYVQCAKLLEDPARSKRVGSALAAELAAYEPDSVLSPALGGLIIGYETAASLRVPFRFCERKGGAMCLRRGFRLGPGERVAVVEDVVTTGGSALEAGRLAQAAGANVVAYGAIIDRSAGSAGFREPFVSLLELEVLAFVASECELCVAGQPLTAPGSRA